MSDSGSFRVIVAGLGIVVLIAVALGMVVLVTSSSGRTSWTDLEVGECFDAAPTLGASDAGDLYLVETIGCTEALDAGVIVAEVVGVGDLNAAGSEAYPSPDDLLDLVDRRCAVLDVDGSRFGLLPIVPDERTWSERRGRYVCLAVPYGR